MPNLPWQLLIYLLNVCIHTHAHTAITVALKKCLNNTGKTNRKKSEMSFCPSPSLTLQRVYVLETLEHIRGVSSHDDREAAESHAEVFHI